VAAITNTGFTTDDIRGFWSRHVVLGGIVTDACGIVLEDAFNIGTITNQFGIRIGALTQGSTNHGIVLDGDGAGSDIVFGATQDSSIYHSTYLTLDSDGGIQIGTGTAQEVGFYGATPVGQATAMTVSDTNIPNSGDATTDAIIANLQTRVDELEAMLDTTTGVGIVA